MSLPPSGSSSDPAAGQTSVSASSTSAPVLSSSPPPPTPSSSSSQQSASDSAAASASNSAVPSPSSSTTTPSTTNSNTPTTQATPSLTAVVSTAPGGGVVTLTQTRSLTQSAPTPSASAAVRSSSNGFLQNKAAMGATFAIVGLVVAGIVFALVTAAIRRRRAKRFDREIAEEAKRAPPPVFVDDDDYNDGYHSDPYSGPTAYADHADGYAGPTAYSEPAHTEGGYPASDALSSGVHSNHGGQGTPSNYMYPSGYSDLGFSDVSSHGTYSQPPMEGQFNPGAYAAYGGAGVGAAGAYEMMGYHNQHQPQGGQEWHPGQQQQEWHAQGYVYPGEEHGAVGGGYPPTATTTNSSGSDVLKSKSGARSLVDSYAPGTAPQHADVAQPKAYADGYVSQYQTHVEDEDAYGGVESHHGHVGGLEDESDDEGDGRRVLKVANN